MALKYLYKENEVLSAENKFVLKNLEIEEVKEEFQEIVYDGPSIDELEAEALVFRQKFEQEKQILLKQQEADLNQIINEEQEKISDLTDELQERREKIEQEIAELSQQKKDELSTWKEEQVKKVEAELDSMRANALEDGKMEGIRLGKELAHNEAQAVIKRLNKVVSLVLDKRNDIFHEIESQVVDLILKSLRKITKTLSRDNAEVVRGNVIAALHLVNSRGNLLIRLNTMDLESISETKNEILELANKGNHIEIIEDDRVDRGGCIIDSEFGSIDARISTQLEALEREIIALKPIEKSGKVV